MWDDADLCQSFLSLLVTLKVPRVLETRGFVLEGKEMVKARALLLAFSSRLSCPIRPSALSVPLELAPEEKELEREMARADALFLSCSGRQFYPVHPLLLSVPLELSVVVQRAVQRALVTLKRWECAFDAVLVLVQARSRSLMLWLHLPRRVILVEQNFRFWAFAWVVLFCLRHVGILVWGELLVAR